MVVRIHNVTKWRQLDAGSALKLVGQAGRKVRIEVNCEAPTSFKLVEDDDRPVFLAVVQGLEVLEFGVSADVADLVASSDGDVWYFTNDGDTHAVEAVQPESFVKIMNRRTRNPQLELIEWRAKQNERRRDAALEDERSQLRAFMAELAARAGANPETGEVGEVSSGTSAGASSGATGAAAGSADTANAGAANGGT